jgi:hypothetical protein
MKKFAAVFLTIFSFMISSATHAQRGERHEFVRYLMAKRFFDEAILEAGRLRKQFPRDDSLSFLLGLAHYEQKDLRASIDAWSAIPAAAPLALQARFFTGYAHAFLMEHEAALQLIDAISPVDSLTAALQNFERAGVHVLLHDFTEFETNARQFGRVAVLRKHEDNLIAYGQLLQKRNRKPWKAGLLQTVLPGAGYFYAGYKGHAIYNLLISTLLGLQAWEGYRKSGPESARFIAYASAFALVHVATIWGSTLAVKIRRDEREKTIHDQILIDMHIPLRTVFR